MKIYSKLFLLIMFCSFTSLSAMEFFEDESPSALFEKQRLFRAAREFSDEVAGKIKSNHNSNEEQRLRLETQIADCERCILDAIRDNNAPVIKVLEEKKQRLTAKLNALDNQERIVEGMFDHVSQIGLTWIGGKLEHEAKEADRKHNLEVEAATAMLKAEKSEEGITARYKIFWDQLADSKKLGMWSSFLVAIPVAIYASKLGLDYAASKWGKPALIRTTSRATLMSTLRERYFGYKKPQVSLDEVVLAPEIQDRIRSLAEKTKNKQKFGAPYQNLLLFGPPGTGKTEFAKLLAQYSGMDYAIMSGADFSQFTTGEAITQINKLFAWANSSPRGLLIFIDEADAFARKREELDLDGIKVLNTFISHCGDSSNKFMLVFATNHENTLDSAVRSRIGDHVRFDLPAQPERAKILAKKIDKHIVKFNFYHEQSKKMLGLSVDDTIDEAYINHVATLMHNFSGRDIDLAVIAMQAEVLETSDRKLTKPIVDDTIKIWMQKVAQDRALGVTHKK